MSCYVRCVCCRLQCEGGAEELTCCCKKADAPRLRVFFILIGCANHNLKTRSSKLESGASKLNNAHLNNLTIRNSHAPPHYRYQWSSTREQQREVSSRPASREEQRNPDGAKRTQQKTPRNRRMHVYQGRHTSPLQSNTVCTDRWAILKE